MTERQCRGLVRARSRGKCECCCVVMATDASHRRARSQGGKWEPANIMDACRRCHSWIELNPTAAHYLGWRLWRGEEPSTTPVRLGRGPAVLLTDDGRYLAAA